MEEYLAFAKGLAQQAGQMIKGGFDSNFSVELKADRTPVTEVDKAINNMVSRAIKEKYPEHGLMGEEADHGHGKEEYQWICDPLDGTKSFVLGVPLTTFVLGLTRKAEMLLAVVYDPFSDRLYHAVKNQGAFCNGQKLQVNQEKLADGGSVIISESSFRYLDGVKRAGGTVEVLPGAGYRSMLVASGKCAGAIQGHAVIYDVGPVSLIIEEAGGKATDLSGQALRYDHPFDNGIILSNGVAHDELVALISATN